MPLLCDTLGFVIGINVATPPDTIFLSKPASAISPVGNICFSPSICLNIRVLTIAVFLFISASNIFDFSFNFSKLSQVSEIKTVTKNSLS